MKKTGHFVMRGTIELLSGTRIGGSDDMLQIGGADSTCIRDPVTEKPYIPGSSLKGKMRSCLEKHLGKSSSGGTKPCACGNPNCPVCVLYGPHDAKKVASGPSRIIVRDAPVIGEYAFENKASTAIDRSSGKGLQASLRSEERVAPGAKFKLEIAIQVFDADSDFSVKERTGTLLKGGPALCEIVKFCLQLVADTGIGAGISKGFGQVAIHLEEPVEIKRDCLQFISSPEPTP